MADPLVDAQIRAQARIRRLTTQAITAIWRGLPAYDRPNLDQWLSEMLPVVATAQRQSVNLTNAYLARSLERQPLPLDTAALIGAAVRNGTPPEVVYERPFVTLWTGLKNGLDYEAAVDKGLARATDMASFDVQGSFRATANAVQEADGGIYGFERVADAGACQFCVTVNGAYVKSSAANPLHPRCGCSLRPLTQPHPNARWLPSGESVKGDGYAIHTHGEMGPTLTDPDQHFTSEADL